MASVASTLPVLRAEWERSGHVARGSLWQPMQGGRSNHVWRVEQPDGAVLVCRLFTEGRENPLFANDPEAEEAALMALSGLFPAPRLVAARRTPLGMSHLLTHIEGRPWQAGDDVEDVAHLLACLHAVDPPSALPPARPSLLPEEPAEGVRAVFLHGDPVPGNILVAANGLALIDWQCPARGDAAWDLALFLSPAMQHVNANPPLTASQREQFLGTYAEAAEAGAVARYKALVPFFHQRIAAYCDWKLARGDDAYGVAGALERAALKGR